MMTSKDARIIMIAIYSKLNSNKIKDIDELLIKYSGYEGELISSIFNKYNISEADRYEFLSNPEITKSLATEYKLIVGNIKHPSNDNEKSDTKNLPQANKFKDIMLANILVIIIIALAIAFGISKLCI